MIKNLRDKSSAELKLLIVQLRSQLMENRFKAAQGELEKNHLIREMRKLVAQTMTVLHERKEPMQTSDWHKYNKVLMEEQSKQSELKDDVKESVLDKLKNSAKKLVKTDKEGADK